MRFEDLRDRLDDEILDADFALRPFHEVIEGLHRSLDLPPPEVAADEEEAGGEGEADDGEDDDPLDPDLPPEPPPPDLSQPDPWRSSA